MKAQADINSLYVFAEAVADMNSRSEAQKDAIATFAALKNLQRSFLGES
jgi:hypothetical protein